jgi:hypothetical protein
LSEGEAMQSKRNKKASGQAGFNGVGGEVKATKKNKILRCSVHHTSKLRQELQAAGLGLQDTSGPTQCQTLLRVLEYLGTRGINTPEGVACGFYRIATRVQELEEEGWIIDSRRERLLGADGLVHIGVARYVLLGRRAGFEDRQADLWTGASE